jgi:hypothetical protein
MSTKVKIIELSNGEIYLHAGETIDWLAETAPEHAETLSRHLVAKRFAHVGCTGLTARWCPIHGTCTCTDPDEQMGEELRDDTGCPLHGSESDHPR